MAGTELKEISSNKMFDGYQKVFEHESLTLGCPIRFGIYLPPKANEAQTFPVIYWLSGLTCTEDNFIVKAGAQKYASQMGVIIVNPDTSPRNLNLPGDKDAYDFGEGASFYVDATQEPWSKHYKMFSYVTSELIEIVKNNFPVIPGKQSITGHSMGGHGALICALKNPGLYKYASAFAPISNPSECPWGIKAFTGYLGPKETRNWEEWDATELIKNYKGPKIEILVDQGLDDQFFKDKQLMPERLLDASRENTNTLVILKSREGYNHSYFYVATFIEEHLRIHLHKLNQ